jgi:uncharacterized alkaline shock family protein YloU
VTRRAVVDIVRAAVVTSYGVTGLRADGPFDRLLGLLRLREPGIRVDLTDGIAIDLSLAVGIGLPIAEVARQVDSAVRYAIRRSLGREVDRLSIHVSGLRFEPASVPAPVAGRTTRARRAVESGADDTAETEPGAADPADAA